MTAGPEVRETTLVVTLPAGDVELPARWNLAAGPWAVLVLAHGADAGMAHPFLAGFAAAAAASGVSTLRFDFPYLAAGRRMPGPAAHAVAAWAAAHAAATELRGDSLALPVFAAGKSYGGRMASMAAAEGVIAPAGLVYLGYPLHPPGRPEAPRVAHLPDVVPPQLFVEGTNDPFVDPHEQLEDAVASCRDASILWIEGGGHSFEVKGRRRPAEEVAADLARPVVSWMRDSLAG